MAPLTTQAHYAVMRIEKDGPPLRFAIETEGVDDDATYAPSVDRVD